MYYGSRYYDATIGRFVQPDTLIPNLYDPQALNRYAYVRNNPVRYMDPTGHMQYCGDDCGTPGSYDYGSDTTSTDTGSPQPAAQPPATTASNQGPSDDDYCSRHNCGDDGGADRGRAGGTPSGERGNRGASGTQATVYSYGWLAGAFENFTAHGWDLVLDWKNNEIGIFEWDARSPNGFVTPQAGVAAQQSYVANMDRLEDYTGNFDVAGGSLGYFAGEVFASENRQVFGGAGGVTLSAPPVGIYSISPEYAMKLKVDSHPAIMDWLANVPGAKWGEPPFYMR